MSLTDAANRTSGSQGASLLYDLTPENTKQKVFADPSVAASTSTGFRAYFNEEEGR